MATRFLLSAGAGCLLLAGASPATAEFAQFTMGVQNYSLPPLPYAYDVRSSLIATRLFGAVGLANAGAQALEPSISAEIMRLHHTKHHQSYVDNLNAANAQLAAALEARDFAGHAALQEALKFNAGGHINHSLFWKNLAPATSPEAKPDAAPKLMREIAASWGGFPQFQKAFTAALLNIKGSGWGWLVKEDGRADAGLRIITTKDQDPPIAGMLPLFGVDMWEHAYYLQVPPPLLASPRTISR